MTFPEVFSVLCIVVGALSGAVYGFLKYGILGGVLGLPVGAVLGWVLMFAGPVLVLVAVVAVVVWVKCGTRAARRFLWGRAD